MAKPTTPPVRAADGIIADLIASRDARLAAGEPVDVRAVEQEITAHRQLAVLRGQHADAVAAKDWLRAADTEGHIAFWLRFVPAGSYDQADTDQAAAAVLPAS